MYGESNKEGLWVGLVLKIPERTKNTYGVKFYFISSTNVAQ